MRLLVFEFAFFFSILPEEISSQLTIFSFHSSSLFIGACTEMGEFNRTMSF